MRRFYICEEDRNLKGGRCKPHILSQQRGSFYHSDFLFCGGPFSLPMPMYFFHVLCLPSFLSLTTPWHVPMSLSSVHALRIQTFSHATHSSHVPIPHVFFHASCIHSFFLLPTPWNVEYGWYPILVILSLRLANKMFPSVFYTTHIICR